MDTASTNEPDRDPCSVYLMYNTTGDLLYVGTTSLGHTRQTQHMAETPWAHEVAITTWEHFDSRAAAATRALNLTRDLEPRYNTAATDQRPGTMNDATRTEWETNLTNLAARRTALHTELATIADDTRALVLQGYAANIPKVTMAKLAGISRPTLNTMLLAQRPERPRS